MQTPALRLLSKKQHLRPAIAKEMFNQVTFADWSGPVAIAAFAISFGLFVFFVVGALRTPKSKIHHDEELPLKGEHRS